MTLNKSMVFEMEFIIILNNFYKNRLYNYTNLNRPIIIITIIIIYLLKKESYGEVQEKGR